MKNDKINVFLYYFYNTKKICLEDFKSKDFFM